LELLVLGDGVEDTIERAVLVGRREGLCIHVAPANKS
jgi:hypothetical protein